MTRPTIVLLAAGFFVAALITFASMASAAYLARIDAFAKPPIASCIVPGGVEVQR